MRDWLLPLIFSAVIVVLQVVFAPILSVAAAVPSFIAAFVMVLSVMRRPDTTYVYAFVLGLIADLLSHTPVGLNALLLLLATFCLSRIFEVLDDSTAAMPIIAFAGTIFVFELVFAIVLMIFGYQGSIIDMLIQRVLPSTVLNTVIAAVLFLIMRRLPFAQQVNDAWQVPNTGRFR